MVLTTEQRSLIVGGALLFLLGLLQGAGIQMFANPRMALSAHLTAVQSGTALMIVGAIWPVLSMATPVATGARLAMISGMYGLWIGLTASAITGASRILPIAGGSHVSNAITETLVAALIFGSSGLMTLRWIMFVIGLVRSSR